MREGSTTSATTTSTTTRALRSAVLPHPYSLPRCRTFSFFSCRVSCRYVCLSFLSQLFSWFLILTFANTRVSKHTRILHLLQCAPTRLLTFFQTHLLARRYMHELATHRPTWRRRTVRTLARSSTSSISMTSSPSSRPKNRGTRQIRYVR